MTSLALGRAGPRIVDIYPETGQLLRHATEVTAVDASAEMLAIAAAQVDHERVRFIQADLFSWKPDRQDVVFIGFWLPHVPLERLIPFGQWWPTP